MKIINIKKTDENAKIPTYGSEFAAGADLYAVIHNEENRVEILSGETAFIDTGIVMEIPNGYVGLVYARSGLSCKQGLAPANKVGVIDSDYRGNIMVALYNQSNETKYYVHNRIPCYHIDKIYNNQYLLMCH